MNIPAMFAEGSLYRSARHYSSSQYSAVLSRHIYPAATRRLAADDVTCDTYCCAVCSCCANKADATCCSNCGSSCPKNVAVGGTGLSGGIATV
jgi:hypothetical protein